MWMCYAMDSWTKAVDLNSSIKRLLNNFDTLLEDLVIRGNRWFTNDELREREEYQTLYSRGVKICEEYLSKKISIEEFWIKMKEADLELFLSEVKPFLYNNNNNNQ